MLLFCALLTNLYLLLYMWSIVVSQFLMALFINCRTLHGFDLVKDRDTGNSKGYGFCVYQVNEIMLNNVVFYIVLCICDKNIYFFAEECFSCWIFDKSLSFISFQISCLPPGLFPLLSVTYITTFIFIITVDCIYFWLLSTNCQALQDPAVTDIACAALNGLKMGDKTLTVRRATARLVFLKNLGWDWR